MNQKILFLHNVAIAIKTAQSGPFGEAFNCQIGIEVPLEQNERLRPVIKSIVGRLDHKALGVDLDLGIDLSGARLTRWLRDTIEQETGVLPVRVQILRGDGIGFTDSPQLVSELD